jgi:HEAT repeat protein
MKVAGDLGALATDSEPDIRMRVALVLEKLGPAGAPAAAALGQALASETEEAIREQVIDALIAMGPGAKPALPKLLPLVTDKSLPVNRRERVIAAVTVADSASKDVAGALLSAAGDADQSIRAAAAGALGKLIPLPAEAVAKLVALAKSDPRTDPRLAALRALAEAGSRAKAAKGDIEPIANGKQQDGQALLAKVALAAIDGDTAKSAAVVRAGLTDKKPDVRGAAVGALVGIGPRPEDLPALLKLLKENNGETREAAVKCLGRLGPAAKEAVPQLTKFLIDDVIGEVRSACATALGDIGPAALASVPKLQEAARNDPPAAPAARKALEKLGVKERK